MTTRNDRTLHRTTALRAPSFGAAALAALAACGSPPAPQAPEAEAPAAEPERAPWPEQAMPESVVHAEFQTSASAIRPGGKFLLAVRFEITPEYRISWSNPGDVGKSTRVSFQVPEGFVVGPLRFPAPSRFELDGRLVNYGYQSETAVFAEVTAPARLSSSEAYRFDVRAEWLACKDDCATESLDAWFELVATPSAPAPALPEELLAHHAALPKDFTQLEAAEHAWTGSPEQPSLALTASEVKWKDFLPADAEQPKLLRMKPKDGELELKFAGRSEDKPLRGLAIGEVEGELAFFDINMPWPSEEDIAASAELERSRAKQAKQTKPAKQARSKR